MTAIARGPGDYRGTSKTGIAGLVLGIVWLAAAGFGVAWLMRHGGFGALIPHQ